MVPRMCSGTDMVEMLQLQTEADMGLAPQGPHGYWGCSRPHASDSLSLTIVTCVVYYTGPCIPTRPEAGTPHPAIPQAETNTWMNL